MRLKKCCFSGHRPKALFGYDRNAYMPLFKQLQDMVRIMYQEMGYKGFITGGAQGFDQLAFWAVDSLKNEFPDIKNIVYIPYVGQELNWPKESMFGQNEYKQMLEKADEVKIISNTQSIGALFQRNNAMIDNSDGIIALYEDDTWKNQDQKGGTAQALRYANIHMMDIYQIVFDKQKKAPYVVTEIQKNIFL